MRALNLYQSGAYQRQVSDWHAGDGAWKAGKIAQLLRRNQLLAPGSVVDVGCGAGEVLRALQPQLSPDTQLVGYDIAPRAIELCRPKENRQLRFVLGDVVGEARERFGLMLVLDVFEHVSDYRGFLEALRARANRFVFHIPLEVTVQAVAKASRPMLYMRAQYGHLHFFTAETAQRALEDSGYTVEDSAYTWDHELDPQVRRERLRHPWNGLRYRIEHWAHRRFPQATARLRSGYNLLVLAR